MLSRRSALGLLAGAGVAGAVAGCGSSNAASSDEAMARALNWEIVTDPKYGADPSGRTDSTAAWQRAIDAAVAGGGQVWAPSGRFLINGELRVSGKVAIHGSYTTVQPGEDGKPGGTVFYTSVDTSQFFIRIEPPNLDSNPNAYIWGVAIRDIVFDGTVGKNPSNRGGLVMRKVWSEISLDRLKFISMKQSGIYMDNCQDGQMTGISMLVVGSEGKYAALSLDLGTNAIHCFGAHIESCPSVLKIGKSSRHNQFVASKFEMYSYGPGVAPILVADAMENDFYGCQFVQRNTDDEFFYSAPDKQPAMIVCDGDEASTGFSDCMFTTQLYQNRPGSKNQGSRWLASARGNVRVTSCVFDSCWGGSGPAAINLGSNGLFRSNTVYVRSHNGALNALSMLQNNIVDANHFIDREDVVPATAGALFICAGENNSFGPVNQILVAAAQYFGGPPRQNVSECNRARVDFPDRVQTPDVGWNNPGASRQFRCNYSAPTVLTGFVHGFVNTDIAVLFSTPGHTVRDSDTLRLKDRADAHPPVDGILTLTFDGAVWREVQRSF